MLNLTCTLMSSVDFAHYRVYRAKDWVSVDCGTRKVLLRFSNSLDVFGAAMLSFPDS